MFTKINDVIAHFEGKEWKLTNISLKTKGNNHKCTTRGAENGHLQPSGRASRA